MTEVHIGQLASRVETTARPPTDDAFVGQVAAEVARRLREAAEVARGATLADEDLFGGDRQEM